MLILAMGSVVFGLGKLAGVGQALGQMLKRFKAQRYIPLVVATGLWGGGSYSLVSAGCRCYNEHMSDARWNDSMGQPPYNS